MRIGLGKGHAATAALCVATALAYAVQMGDIGIRGMLVPLICIAIMIAGAVSALICRDRTLGDVSINGKEIVTLLSIAAYAGLVDLIGFYAASFLFSAFLFLHVAGFTKRMSIPALLNALGVIATVYAIFNLFLDYYIPEGLLMEYLAP